MPNLELLALRVLLPGAVHLQAGRGHQSVPITGYRAEGKKITVYERLYLKRS